MRVMVMVKANEASEAGQMPSEQELAAMGAFNEELVKAGVMLDGDGLHPSREGYRVTISPGTEPSVTDGPFAETKELIAGYWIWQVKDMDEALAWAKRIPALGPDTTPGTVELRPLFEADDFGEEFTPELQAQEERLRKQIAGG
ncbi:MAG TPA: YciI family protein [Solirubrobacterales bacterium]|jgi:hypothetical protein|nr:YciI family protein [Solirubrobacterales bacterium]